MCRTKAGVQDNPQELGNLPLLRTDGQQPACSDKLTMKEWFLEKHKIKLYLRKQRNRQRSTISLLFLQYFICTEYVLVSDEII